jgi:hypothetical protein
MAAELYEIHGLVVESEFRLDARRVRPPPAGGAGGSGTGWYRILEGKPRRVPFTPPQGRRIGELHFDGFGFWASEHGDGESWLLRYGGVCDAALDRRRRTVTVHPDVDADRGEVALIVGGGIIAHVLMSEGRLLIHASAVERRGAALAFVGGSGAGKSTLAALMCAAGARLVTDDALRCDPHDGEVSCFPGSLVLRLRPEVASLAGAIGDAVVTETADGRTAVAPPACADRSLRLSAVIVPTPSHTAADLEVERLDRMAGLIEVVRFPRLIGWRQPQPIRRLFELTGALAELVPVFRATVPWGPPFAPRLAERVLAAVGLEVSP